MFRQLWKECTCFANCICYFCVQSTSDLCLPGASNSYIIYWPQENKVWERLTYLSLAQYNIRDDVRKDDVPLVCPAKHEGWCKKGWHTSRLPSKTWGTMCGRQRASIATISIPSAFGSLDIWNSHQTLKGSLDIWNSHKTLKGSLDIWNIHKTLKGSLNIWNSHKTLSVSTISWHSVSTIYHLQKRSTVS